MPFLRYVRAKIAEDDETLSYRAYVTDSLQLHGMNQYKADRWIDLILPKPKDARTGDEIAASVIARVGLKCRGDGNGPVQPGRPAEAG